MMVTNTPAKAATGYPHKRGYLARCPQESEEMR